MLWAGNDESRYSRTPLRGFIAFYPPCGEVIAYGGNSPLLLLLGGKDDWAPPESCRLLAEVAKQAGRPVTAVVYPEARHAFDASRLRGVVYVPDARRGRGATIAYDPQAHEDSLKQVRKFLHQHLGIQPARAPLPQRFHSLGKGNRQREFALTSPEGYVYTLCGLRDKRNTRDDLAKLGKPALIVHGDGDEPSIIEAARRLHRAMPASRYAVVPAAEHVAQDDNPATFNRVLVDFLRTF